MALTNAERQRRFRERRRDRLHPPPDVRTVDMFVDSVTPVTPAVTPVIPSDQAGRLFKVTATDGQNRPCSYFVLGCPICGKPPVVWFTFNGLEFQCKPCQLRVSTVGHVSPGDSVERWNDRKRDDVEGRTEMVQIRSRGEGTFSNTYPLCNGLQK